MDTNEFNLEIGKYYRKMEVSETWSTANQGGIRVSTSFKKIVLFSDKPRNETGNENPYNDAYDQRSGIIKFMGTGKSGDQGFHGSSPSGINRRLRDHQEQGYMVHYFRESDHDPDQFRYEGEAIYLSHKFVKYNEREVIVFTLLII